ncbi:MAG: PAS domain-containing protein [Burkholderiales bacterium]
MSLRGKVLAPLAGSVIAVLGLFACWQVTVLPEFAALLWSLAAAGLLLIALSWLSVELGVRRPLAALVGPGREGDELQALSTQIRTLRKDLAKKELDLSNVTAYRQRAEHALRENEERYMLAVRGANDGLWEWDIASGSMYLSPRWKAMLGLDVEDIKNHFEAWKTRIHPNDRPAVEDALTKHLQGATDRFESQHRILHRDASFRWVLSRGTALRHANGRAYRVIGLDTDITQYRRMEEILRHLVEGTASATGDEFFRELVKHFAGVLGVRQAFVTECCDYPTTRLRPLATWDGGRFIDDPEYDLAGTPCEEVVLGNKSSFYSHGVDQHFECSRIQGFRSYFGMPIADSQGKVIGHLAFQGPEIINEELILESVYKIFVARAAAELERRQVQRVVLELANGLSQAHGDESFHVLVKTFSAVTQMRDVFIAECMEQPPRSMRVLAFLRDGEFQPPSDYGLSGTTCEETVMQGRICHYASGLGERFPYAREFQWQSYLGVPVADSQGRVLGHFAAMDKRPMERSLPDEAILKLFAQRAAVEFSRKRLTDTLMDVADKLSSLRGEECFRTMVKDLCHAMGVREAFVCECTDVPPARVR